MRASVIVLIGCVTLALAGARPAAAEPSPQWQRCTDKGQVEPDRRIAACTAVIESGRETKHDQAVAFTTRGRMYVAKGDRARGIPDFTEAIRLDPKDGHFFSDRGNAYYGTGERD